jgi:alanine dehydrogenase
VAGLKPGRESRDEITIFESDGTYMQSASVVWLVYQKAMKEGLGRYVRTPSSFFVNP